MAQFAIHRGAADAEHPGSFCPVSYTHLDVYKRQTIAIIFIVMLLSSLCTELIGVHALFGAFMAGVIMPQQWHFRQIVTDKVEDVALILLLPLFFVITGLRTHINAVNTPTPVSYTHLDVYKRQKQTSGGLAGERVEKNGL